MKYISVAVKNCKEFYGGVVDDFFDSYRSYTLAGKIFLFVPELLIHLAMLAVLSVSMLLAFPLFVLIDWLGEKDYTTSMCRRVRSIFIKPAKDDLTFEGEKVGSGDASTNPAKTNCCSHSSACACSRAEGSSDGQAHGAPGQKTSQDDEQEVHN